MANRLVQRFEERVHEMIQQSAETTLRGSHENYERYKMACEYRRGLEAARNILSEMVKDEDEDE